MTTIDFKPEDVISFGILKQGNKPVIVIKASERLVFVTLCHEDYNDVKKACISTGLFIKLLHSFYKEAFVSSPL